MFWEYKTFSHIRGTQCTLNQTRTRSKTFFIDGNLKFLIFSRKSSPKKLYLSQNILPDVALRVSRKFSTEFVGVFWQWKTFSKIRGTQRTLNQIHTTRQSFYIEAEAKNWILTKLATQKANFASEYSTLFGEFLTLRASRKFSRQLENMFWACKTFSQIRGTQRTLNQTRTISKTF